METINYQGQEVQAAQVNYLSETIPTSAGDVLGDEQLFRDAQGRYYLQRKLRYLAVNQETGGGERPASGRTHVHRISLTAAILWATTRLNSTLLHLRWDAVALLRLHERHADVLAVLDDHAQGLLRQHLTEEPGDDPRDVLNGAMDFFLSDPHAEGTPDCSSAALKWAKDRRLEKASAKRQTERLSAGLAQQGVAALNVTRQFADGSMAVTVHFKAEAAKLLAAGCKIDQKTPLQWVYDSAAADLVSTLRENFPGWPAREEAELKAIFDASKPDAVDEERRWENAAQDEESAGRAVPVTVCLPPKLFRLVEAMTEYDGHASVQAAIINGMEGDALAFLECRAEGLPEFLAQRGIDQKEAHAEIKRRELDLDASALVEQADESATLPELVLVSDRMSVRDQRYQATLDAHVTCLLSEYEANNPGENVSDVINGYLAAMLENELYDNGKGGGEATAEAQERRLARPAALSAKPTDPHAAQRRHEAIAADIALLAAAAPGDDEQAEEDLPPAPGEENRPEEKGGK